jgi:peroxiredoxin
VREVLKLLAIIAIVGGAALGFISLQERRSRGLEPGAAVPEFRLPGLSGGTTDLASLRGRVVLVNFWATWCPPCVAEMPALERLSRALGPQGLVVLGVSVDEDETALRDFAARHGLTFAVLRDRGAHTAAAYRTVGYPQTFLVGRDGTLVRTFLGPAEWDTPEALGYFRGLLAGARVAAPSTSPAR